MKENKMGTMPILPLVLNMALPMMASMLILALYNVVDSIFVSMVSENAFTAVSLAYPLQLLIIAVGAGTGAGINALTSRSLGQQDQKRAQIVAMNGLFLSFCSYLLFLLIAIFVVKPFFYSQTDVADILTNGIQYGSIVCGFSFGCFFSMTFERLLQATGRTMLAMYVQGLGAVVNLILDPILIFGLFGAPKLGVAGAAVATVAGQILGACLAVYFCLRKNPEIPLVFKGFRPDTVVIRAIYKIGVPVIFMQAVGSVMTYGMNLILIKFSTTATAVFGAYFKLQSFVFMPVFGLNNAMIPIVAYNYGARKPERIRQTFCCGLGIGFAILACGCLAFQLIPHTLLGLFNATPEMLAMGVPALRIIGISFLVAFYCILSGSVFQGLGYAMCSLYVSATRQLVVLLPVAYLLSLTGSLSAVWWAFPIAEVASVLATTVFLRRTFRTVNAELQA